MYFGHIHLLMAPISSFPPFLPTPSHMASFLLFFVLDSSLIQIPATRMIMDVVPTMIMDVAPTIHQSVVSLSVVCL